MVYDVILFNGEKELFDVRYNILKEYVDKFIVVEFSETFSGKQKVPTVLEYPNVSYFFCLECDKGDAPPEMPPAFRREYSQREWLKNFLTHLADDDIVAFGDCDEIWDKAMLDNVGKRAKLLSYSYYLNLRSSESFPWGTVLQPYNVIKRSKLNDMRSSVPQTIEYTGWHFSNLKNGLLKKLESYSHQEYDREDIKNSLDEKINTLTDYLGRGFSYWIDENPPFDVKKYKELCLL